MLQKRNPARSPRAPSARPWKAGRSLHLRRLPSTTSMATHGTDSSDATRHARRPSRELRQALVFFARGMRATPGGVS